jgi:hypothetical protein
MSLSFPPSLNIHELPAAWEAIRIAVYTSLAPSKIYRPERIVLGEPTELVCRPGQFSETYLENSFVVDPFSILAIDTDESQCKTTAKENIYLQRVASLSFFVGIVHEIHDGALGTVLLFGGS